MAPSRAHYIQAICSQMVLAWYGQSVLIGKAPAPLKSSDRHAPILRLQKEDESLPRRRRRRETPSIAPSIVPPEDKVRVEFGILVKNPYDVDLASGTFTTDSIIVARWTDERNSALIPHGKKEFTVSDEEASDIWTPNIKVTNFAKSGVSPISTSFLIEPGGVTTKVERDLLTTLNNFEYKDFPFDKQPLEIRIASGTYMADQVFLTPLSNASYSGIEGTTVGSWRLVNTSIFSIVETDGLLSKSRGILQIMVARPLEQFATTVFIPSVLLMGMSWGSFFFPVAIPFAMPRVSLNAIALLAQVTLASRVGNLTPQGQVTWLDQYLQTCFALQFLLLFQTITILSLTHKFEQADFANHVLLGFPLLWTANLLVLLFVSAFSLLFVVMSTIFYIAYHVWVYHTDQDQEADQENAKPPTKRASCFPGLRQRD